MAQTGPKPSPADAALERVRAICRALPEAQEKSDFRPSFHVRGKSFVMFMDDHHGDGRLAVWCKAPPAAQDALVRSDPQRFFVPPYVGPRGWVGVTLDGEPDWDAVAAIIEDGWRMSAPVRLVRERAGGA